MALKGMDRSLNSLNSKRNLKLPPIQGALPANTFGHATWTAHKPPSLTTQPARPVRTRIPRETISLNTQNIVCTARQPVQSRVNTATHRSSLAAYYDPNHVVKSVDVTLGHQFPKSYDVLPPIRNKPSNAERRSGERTSQNGVSPSEREGRHSGKSPGVASELLSERRRERQNRQKQKQSISSSEGSSEKTTAVSENGKDEKPEGKVKNSPTFLLFLKCTRFGRRGGVCVDNEGTLENVTEQLKEIFLRRNMEEMYLI
ncbi:uncharacterized protein LOC116603366 [Nematostella vectensis]|uniref:uncharacterized protein LOC116603366 n=1 Tax=Nematostella vectensis TaxID=45351 RepID=UPI00138FBF32|nr:uncharacterized protein LOC116603366 [Nematostella vectensis]